MRRAAPLIFAAMLPAVAAAQEEGPSAVRLDVQRFDPAPQSASFTLVPDADPDANPRFGFAVSTGYAYSALTTDDVGLNSQHEGAIDHLLAADVVLHGAPAPFISLGMQLAVVQGVIADKGGSDPTLALGGYEAGAGVGDLALSARFLPVRRSGNQPFSLAIGPRVVVPTGFRKLFLGAGGVGLGVEATASGRWPYLWASASLGYQVQTVSARVGKVYADDELRYGAALGVPFQQDRWRFDMELAGAAVLTRAARDALGASWSPERHAPAEVDLGFTHRPKAGPFWVKVGGGTGLTRAWGTPDLRVFGQLGWSTQRGAVRPQPGAVVVDRDDDGFGDAVDPCPDLAEDGGPDAGGDDGCPDVDADGDRIADGRDECPRYPEDFDLFEDVDGCPDPDNDGDAIPDTRDGHRDALGNAALLPGLAVGDCANTPESYNGVEDSDGCPDAGLAEVRGKEIVLLEPVYFDTNEATIRPESRGVLSALAQLLQAWPQIELVEVAGHADARGDDVANLALSDARAASVRAWLVAAGVSPQRLVTRGYGEWRPSVPGADTSFELSLNRRVQIVILRMQPGGPTTGYGAR